MYNLIIQFMIEDWSEGKWKLNKLKWQDKNSESEKKKHENVLVY